ncbi:MAG: hypothetical protein J6I76_06055 [Oribacterium sp.]|nr:hypothetical protein [Oribacterium sp.]
MLFIVSILAIHYIIWTMLFIGRLRYMISCSYIDLGVAFLIPIFGLLFVLVRTLSDRHSDREADIAEVDPLIDIKDKEARSDSTEYKSASYNSQEDRELTEEPGDITKSIVMDEDDVREKVVPLEEALVINDTATRRELLIDVLYSDPEGYVPQLFNAKQNGDTEVVHYAATALTEIMKKFDLEFQDIMKRKSAAPLDEELDVEYRKLLERYISSGLLEGDGLKNQLKKYSGLLKKELSKNSVRGKWTLINKKADADLKLHDQDALDEDIKYMKERWPEREGTYVAMLQSAILRKDRKEIRRTVSEIDEKGIYLSTELKSLVRFWGEDEMVS